MSFSTLSGDVIGGTRTHVLNLDQSNKNTCRSSTFLPWTVFSSNMCEHLTAGCVFLKQTWLMSVAKHSYVIKPIRWVTTQGSHPLGKYPCSLYIIKCSPAIKIYNCHFLSTFLCLVFTALQYVISTARENREVVVVQRRRICRWQEGKDHRTTGASSTGGRALPHRDLSREVIIICCVWCGLDGNNYSCKDA